MTELAAEAGVSTALVSYHFKDRAGILRQTLEFISNCAEHYTAGSDGDAGDAGDAGAEHLPRDPLRALEHALLLEFQDLPEVPENSTAWGRAAEAGRTADARHTTPLFD
ncbi:TetR family transcriptional regulator [Streptomyces flavofungini]|uniref:TetR family transcriptional regulator n=1 Tax=Streptomyces flavofungini TaxID=68200 RepID=A0ABS0X509_9ACTN|nr:TetR family transcriptional regulator [Streptomyces flavofungini]MBJ3808283.1 TetR family transcriptional regulator [Streptomyces flavofungini]GHC57609.1 hypothetical protein GCM10010349_25630 [Streptomyces flavofungini]